MTELVFCCDQYAVIVSVGGLPLIYSSLFDARLCLAEDARRRNKRLVGHAVLSEDLGIRSAEGTALFFATGSSARAWPDLVVALRFSPGPLGGFHPGILLVPERDLVFVGAGTTLLAYKLAPVRRLWQDVADCGFWRWRRHGDIVLMSAELELDGRKLWSTFVEPPWSYKVRGDRVELDVMGQRSDFLVATGPQSVEAG